jgi:hypothetical protein
MKKILPYLLLNIFLSALTMLGVILIWNATHKTPKQPAFGLPIPLQTTKSATIQSTLPALNEKTVAIQSVLVSGDLANEKVILKSVSSAALDLSGWSILDQQGHRFTFPAFSIYPDGAVSIYSRAGINSAVELFWGSDQALWSSGETVSLLDSANNSRSTYTIP